MNVKNYILGMLIGTSALAQESETNESSIDSGPANVVSISSSVANAQVWNGKLLHNGPVLRQEVSYENPNVVIAVADNKGEGYGLRDFTFLYFNQVQGMGVMVGGAYNTWLDYETFESFVGVDFPSALLKPSLTFTKDHKSGEHLRARVSQGFDLGKRLSLDLGAFLDVGNNYIDDSVGLRHIGAEATINARLFEIEVGEKGKLGVGLEAGYRQYLPLQGYYQAIGEANFMLQVNMRFK